MIQQYQFRFVPFFLQGEVVLKLVGYSHITFYCIILYVEEKTNIRPVFSVCENAQGGARFFS